MKNKWLLFLILVVAGACKKNTTPVEEGTTPPKVFTNIVILGNSITYSESNPSIGWNNSWGMAASTLEKDYVHLLSAQFKQVNAAAQVRATNISGFEINYAQYDFNQELKTYRDAKPDLLIMRIGENVQQVTFNATLFEQRYSELISYMKNGNPNLVVLTVGTFWPDRGYVNAVMEKHQPYLSIEPLGADIANYAFDMPNVTQAVKGHPGDKGMQAIANMIWAEVQSIH